MKVILLLQIFVSISAFSQNKELYLLGNRFDSNSTYNIAKKEWSFPNRKMVIKYKDSIFINDNLIFSKADFPSGFTNCFYESFGDDFVILTFGGDGLKGVSQTCIYRRSYMAIISFRGPVAIHYINLGGRRICYKKSDLKYMAEENDHGFVIEDIDTEANTITFVDYLNKKTVVPFLLSFSRPR
ncbi:MAG: hypothetical protein NTW29_18045 [Bacteroidetes bacterium]|nr:hypothetical protein [Bacteroidota bacterium]